MPSVTVCSRYFLCLFRSCPSSPLVLPLLLLLLLLLVVVLVVAAESPVAELLLVLLEPFRASAPRLPQLSPAWHSCKL